MPHNVPMEKNHIFSVLKQVMTMRGIVRRSRLKCIHNLSYENDFALELSVVKHSSTHYIVDYITQPLVDDLYTHEKRPSLSPRLSMSWFGIIISTHGMVLHYNH